jgi:drug/metabolite transporter (DMT)-like permease
MAATNISLRQMKGLHEYTASSYAAVLTMTIFGLSLPLTGTPITVFDTFQGYEFAILLFVSLAGGTAMIAKTKAFQYEKAGRLGMLTYLTILFTLLFDLILIGTTFNTGEIQGIAIILGANVLSAWLVFNQHFIRK